jgi:hypothetical protein
VSAEQDTILGSSPVLFDQLHPERPPVRPCPRGVEECSGFAEEEIDGIVRYWVCQGCGFEFDYTTEPVSGGHDDCQLGVPEEIRRRASAPMEEAVAATSFPRKLPLVVRSSG